MPHASFDRRYIWVACAMALGAGFSIAGHLSFILGFSFSPGPGFTSFVQTHGHVQLVGWAGLLIIGISMHVMPRMAGVPLARPQWRSWILWFITWGLGLRVVGHALVAYVPHAPELAIVLGAVVAIGAVRVAGYLPLSGAHATDNGRRIGRTTEASSAADPAVYAQYDAGMGVVCRIQSHPINRHDLVAPSRGCRAMERCRRPLFCRSGVVTRRDGLFRAFFAALSPHTRTDLACTPRGVRLFARVGPGNGGVDTTRAGAAIAGQ